MSSFAWMKVLESSAERYDRGMRMLSRGRIEAVYRRVAALAVGGGAGESSRAAARPHPRVLDIGCGTGGVALACAAAGAEVVGIDRNAGMLEVARRKAWSEAAGGSVRWLELGAAEIEDRFGAGSFEAVVSCLAFSEMSLEERAYTLRIARSRLVPGGRLVLADAVEPRSRSRRALRRLALAPWTALAFLLTQATARPVPGLPELVSAAGFVDVAETRLWGDTFAVVSATAPADDPAEAAA